MLALFFAIASAFFLSVFANRRKEWFIVFVEFIENKNVPLDPATGLLAHARDRYRKLTESIFGKDDHLENQGHPKLSDQFEGRMISTT